jgi:hypothetical protein
VFNESYLSATAMKEEFSCIRKGIVLVAESYRVLYAVRQEFSEHHERYLPDTATKEESTCNRTGILRVAEQSLLCSKFGIFRAS